VRASVTMVSALKAAGVIISSLRSLHIAHGRADNYVWWKG